MPLGVAKQLSTSNSRCCGTFCVILPDLCGHNQYTTAARDADENQAEPTAIVRDKRECLAEVGVTISAFAVRTEPGGKLIYSDTVSHL